MRRFIPRFLCALIFALLLSGSLAAAGETSTPEDQALLYKRARYELFSGDYEKGVAMCERMIEQDPTVAWPYELQFEAMYDRDDKEDWMAVLTGAIEAGAEHSGLYYLRSYVLDDLGRGDEAAADYEKYVALEAKELGKDPLEWHTRFFVSLYQLDDAKAREICEGVIRKTPKTAWAYVLLASIENYELGFDPALKILEEGFAAGAESANMYSAKAYLHTEKAYAFGDDGVEAYENARIAIEKAIEMDGSVAEYHQDLGSILYELGDDENARIACALGDHMAEPADDVCLEALFDALTEAGRPEEALPYYFLWQECLPDTAEWLALLRLAEEAYENGDYEKAASRYEDVLNEDTPPVVTLHYLDCLLKLQKYEEALFALDEDIGAIRDSVSDGVLYGDVYFAMGDLHFAEHYYRETLEFPYSDYDYQKAQERLAALQKHLPKGVPEALEKTEWAGYEVIASAYYNEISQPPEVFAVVRKDGHTALCYLERTKDDEVYALTWANDRAVRQGDEIPVLSYDGHVGGILLVRYDAEAVEKDMPAYMEYMFVLEEDAEEWDFAYMSRNYVYDTSFGVSEVSALTMETGEEGGLAIRWRYYYPYEGFKDEEEVMASMPRDAEAYRPETFDLSQCEKDFDELYRRSEAETVHGVGSGL